MILENLYRMACLHGDEVAIISSGESMSYSELWREASRLAWRLKDTDRPLLLYGHKQPRMLAAFIGCLLSGCPWVPVDHSLPKSRIEEIAKATEATELLALEAAPELEGLSVLTWEELPTCYDIVRELPDDEDSTAYIMYSSGSSGKPKAIPISAANLENFASWICSHNELAEASKVVVNQANLSFDLSIADICSAFCNGGKLVLTSKEEQFNLSTLFALLKKEDGSLLVCTPTFLRLCLCDRSFCQEEFPRLQAVFLCGELLTPSTVKLCRKRFPALKIFNAYGPTEATCAVCGLFIEDEHLDMDTLPVGRLSTAAVDISLLDREILLAGKSVFKGYLGQDVSTKPYHSGDLGKIDGDFLFCLGRKDSQTKYLGYRIDLEEIRLAIEAVPAIEQAVVLAERDSDGRVRRLCAYLSPLPQDINELRSKLKEKLPDYMIPGRFLPMEQVPLSSNTKTKLR